MTFSNHTKSKNKFIMYAGTVCTAFLAVFPYVFTPDQHSQPSVHSEKYSEQNVNVLPRYADEFVTQVKEGAMVHVSSIAALDNGRIACVWYQGSREGARDVSIYLALYDASSGSWSTPQVLVTREQAEQELNRSVKKLGNPLLFRDSEKRLWLIYASVFVGGWSGTSLNYKVSEDDGRTWSRSRKMVLGPFFNIAENVKNKGLNLSDGSFLIPAYHEFIRQFPLIIRLTPYGDDLRYEAWKIPTGRKAIQPALVHESNGSLVAFFRNMEKRKDRYILTARSSDLGRTWSPLQDTDAPNPNSGFDVIRMDDGAYLAAVNNSFDNRSNLTLMISDDQGKHWKTVTMLDNAPGKKYAYPSFCRDSYGNYHVTYTHEDSRIKHVMFNDAWIRSRR